MQTSTAKQPQLTEFDVRHFLSSALEKSHIAKQLYYKNLYSILIGVGFAVLIGLIVMYRRKKRLTPEEKAEKFRKGHEYVMERIRKLKENQIQAEQRMLTGLPYIEFL